MKKNILLFSVFWIVQLVNSQVGIGTTSPDASSILDITATDKGILVPRVSLSNVNDTMIDGVNTAATGLLIYNTNASVTGGSGVGFYYFNGITWEKFSGSTVGATNGLSLSGTDVILGGTLNQSTTINANNYDFILNLDSTGDFHIQDALTPHFSVFDNGTTYFGDDTYWRDGSTGSGDILARIYDSSDDGVLDLYEDNAVNIRLHSNGTTIFNSQNISTNDFRIESVGSTYNFFSDASTNRIGIGTATPAEDLHVYSGDAEVASIYATGNTQGSGMFYAGQSTTYGGGFVYDGDNTPVLVGGTDRITFFRRDLGTDTDVMSYAYNSDVLRITNLAGIGNRMVIANANGDLSTQAIPSSGDITGVTAGSGLTGGGSVGTLTVNANANNGLNVDATADAVQLGGALTEDTTISNGAFDINFNLDSSGDFYILDAGVAKVNFRSSGISVFGDDTIWADENVLGTQLAYLSDGGDNDGRFRIYENGLTSIDLNANTNVIFNEQGLDRDFRVESLFNNGMLMVDASTNRVGIGTDAPEDTLHIVGDILLTGGVRNIETQTGDQNIQIDDTNPIWNGETYGGVTRFYGDGTLAASKLEAGGLELQRLIQIQGGNPALGRVLTSDATGNATWQDPNTLVTGDISAVTAGDGLTGGGTTGALTLNVVATNGLTDNANDIRLGGTLVQDTEILQGNFGMTYNLNGTGDFSIQDSGVDHFLVADNGLTYFGDDTYWRDGSTSGTTIALLTDDNDDGRFRILENGFTSVDLDANTQFVFNEQGLDRDFRVESDNRTLALAVDAALDLVRIGAIGSTTGDGTIVGGVTADYVADFDTGLATGTAIGIGSIEFIVDGNSETLINNAFSPTTHLNRDLGSSAAARAWDDVYADDFVNVSDFREKESINELSYGLDEVLQMRPVSYVLKQDPFKEKKLGLIAQEALLLVPESVKTHDYKVLDESIPEQYTKVELERMGMTYSSLIPVIIKATQEQQDIIDQQNEKINKLEKEIEELKKLIKSKL